MAAGGAAAGLPGGSQEGERVLLSGSGGYTHLIGEKHGCSAGEDAENAEREDKAGALVFLFNLGAEACAHAPVVGLAAVSAGRGGNGDGRGGIGILLHFAIADEHAVHIAELKGAAGGEADLLHAGAADFGAVGGTKVGERPGTAVEDHFTMMAGHGVISDDELVVIGTTHGHTFGVEFEGAGGTVRSGELNTRHNGAVLAGRGRGGKRDSRQAGAGLRGRGFSARKAGNHLSLPLPVTQIFEILGKFDTESDCHKLLYAPHPLPLKYREGRVYKIEFDGDESALKAFVDKVLIDPISQEARVGGQPAFEKAAFVLEYGMKGAALDLEKEMILNYYRSTPNAGFELKKLTLRTRIYVFGEGAEPAQFVRDIVNPAIHTHEVLKAA